MDSNNDMIVGVKVEEFCKRLELETLVGKPQDTLTFSTVNVNRPGLQLAGFYGHFVPKRAQVIGEMEMEYLRALTSNKRKKVLDELFCRDIPCLIISTSIEPCPEILESAKNHSRIVLRSKSSTTQLINMLVIYLNDLLAPNLTIHGVLVDIFGVGVLLIGRSSVGKSETVLELIQRYHRLVADDAVIIKRVNNRLIGSSPEIIRNFMEVRGIGIIDISSMFGAGAVKLTKVIDLVVELETCDDTKIYDRLGEDTATHTILDISLSKLTIPVKPGRNLASILEVAARNYRLKSMGYDTLQELNNRVLASQGGHEED